MQEESKESASLFKRSISNSTEQPAIKSQRSVSETQPASFDRSQQIVLPTPTTVSLSPVSIENEHTANSDRYALDEDFEVEKAKDLYALQAM